MRTLLVAFCATLSATLAIADDESKLGPQDVFGMFGYSEKANVTDKACLLTMMVDEDKVVENIGLLQKLGQFNSEMTERQLKSKPRTLSLVFAMQITPVAIKALYENNKSADKCRFVMNVQFTDEYGQSKTQQAYGFGFTRAINAKINWDKFQSANLYKVTTGFAFDQAYQKMVQTEQ